MGSTPTFSTKTFIDILKIFILQTPVIQYVFVIIDTLQSINYIYFYILICTSNIIINTISKKSKVTNRLIKSVRGIPWLSEAMKDVISCEKLRGVAHTY